MPYTPTTNPNPTFGQSGSSVATLQQSLNKKNAGKAGYVPLKVDSKFGPLTQAAMNFGAEAPTTVSNTNAMDKVPGFGQTLDKYKDKGVRDDKYADGTMVDDFEDEDQYNSTLNTMKSYLDASTKKMIDSIQRKYATTRTRQEEVNRRAALGMKNALLMGGVTGQGSSAQYAPISSEGIMQAQNTYGLEQIADLDAQEQDLIAQAEQSQMDGEYKLMEKQLDLIQDKRKEKQAAAAKINEKMSEQAEIARKEGAIQTVYDQGITDPGEVLKTLRDNGITVTAKEASDTVALLSGQGGSGIVGEYNFYKSEAKRNGQTPVDFNTYQNMDANRKRLASGVASDSGLNAKETQNFLRITDKFQADPFINNAIKGQTAISIADQVLADPGSATNQLKSLYTLVKNLDPDSAVREGEVSLAEKTQSYLSKWATTLTRIEKGQVISPQAAKDLANATKDLAGSWADTAKRRQTQYKSQAKVAGIGDAFDEYIAGSDLGYGGGNLIQSEDQAKTKIMEYSKSNPEFSQKISVKLNAINPFTGQKFTFMDLLDIYPEAK